jgi:hypothetical protein
MPVLGFALEPCTAGYDQCVTDDSHEQPWPCGSGLKEGTLSRGPLYKAPGHLSILGTDFIEGLFKKLLSHLLTLGDRL